MSSVSLNLYGRGVRARGELVLASLTPTPFDERGASRDSAAARRFDYDRALAIATQAKALRAVSGIRPMRIGYRPERGFYFASYRHTDGTH